jgi:branched-chain amino acid transport system ATP-binding protein
MNPKETRMLVDLMHAILDKGISVMLIEHDMKLVMSICNGWWSWTTAH